MVQTGQVLGFSWWVLRSGQGQHPFICPRVGAETPSAAFPVPELIRIVGSGCLADCGAVSMAATPSLSIVYSPKICPRPALGWPGLRKDFLNGFSWVPTSILSCVGHSNSLL